MRPDPTAGDLTGMSKFTVLLVGPDDLSRRLTAEGLEVYDHVAITADDGDQAAALLRSGRRVHVLVVDADEVGADLDGLALARLARDLDRRIMVIYTSRRPQAVPESRKVPGAPTLRTPYWPHQITSVLAELRVEAVETPVAVRRAGNARRLVARSQAHAAEAR